MIFLSIKIFRDFIDDEADHFVFVSLVLWIKPLIQVRDLLVDVLLSFLSFGLVLVFLLILFVKVDRFRDPLAEFSDLHVEVEVYVENLDETLNGRFWTLKLDHKAGVGLYDV